MVATAARIGWEVLEGSGFIDDLGNKYDCLSDSPQFIKIAVKDSVRKWTLAKVIEKYPRILPERPDFQLNGMQLLDPISKLIPVGVVDLTPAASRLTNAKSGGSKQCSDWQPCHRASLTSAFSGGQWPQARLASTRDWVDDNLC